MSKAEDGNNAPEGVDKSFIRKANSLRPQSSGNGPMGNKYEAMMDRIAEASLTRRASTDVFGVGSSSSQGQVPLMYVDPMFDPILLMFPKENLKELNRRLRHYRTYHPIVKNLIDLHSTFPFSDMEVRCEDKGLEPYWQDLSTRLNLMQMVTQMSGDYELLGECHCPTTRILMLDGTHKQVRHIQVGDEVITSTGLPGKVKYRTSKPVSEQLVGLSIDGKRFSWMTKDHPVLRTENMFRIGNSRKEAHPISREKKLKFVRADELHVGDLVAIPAEIFLSSQRDPVNRIPGYESIEMSGTLAGMQLLPIKKIKHKHYSGKVYSMEIDGDPTYIADGIIVHNSFHVGNWDDMQEEWSEFNQIPPENIDVHKVYVGPGVAYFLKPDDELRKVLGSSKEIDQAVADMLPEEYRSNISQGKPTHLDNSRVIHYARKNSGYLTRGESPIKAALKYLLAEDKLYMFMLALIERCTFPIKLWKVGSKEQKWLPSRKHLDALKSEVAKLKCFTADTEILTEEGFKAYTAIKSGEKLATVNPATGEMTYEVPTSISEYEWGKDGWIHEDKGKDMDLGNLRAAAVKASYSREILPEWVSELRPSLIREFLQAYISVRKVYLRQRGNRNLQEIRIRSKALVAQLQFLFEAAGYETDVVEYNLLPHATYLLQFKELGKKMVHFKSETVDLMVTPNHKVLTRLPHTDNWRRVRADEVFASSQLRTCATWKGVMPESGDKVNIAGLTFNLEDFMKFVGFSVSEGHHGSREVSIHQAEKTTDFVQAIDDLLPRLPFTTHTYRHTTNTVVGGKPYSTKMLRYVVCKPALAQYMRSEFGTKANNKRLPAWVKNLPPKYLSVLLDALMLGDGHVGDYTTSASHNGKTYSSTVTRYRYYTSSLALAKDIQEICLKLGGGSRFRTRVMPHPTKPEVTLTSYYVDFIPPGRKIAKRLFPFLRAEHIQHVEYSGKVFCPTMPTHHTVVVRRNGNVCVTGQSDPDADLFYHAYMDMEYKTGSDKHEDLIKWFDWTQKRILIALAANEAMFAEANPYAKEAMSIKLIMHRYMLQRTLVNNLVSNKVWMPVAKKRGYIIHTRAEACSGIDGDKTYIPDIKKYAVPKLFWRPSNLVSGMQEQEYLLKLREKGDMPAEVINDLLGYDQDKIKAALEAEQGTPLDPRWRDALKELLKNPEILRQIVEGKKVKEITLPDDLSAKAAVPPKGPGRPEKPEDEKVKPPRAIIPNDVQSPREKQQEKGSLPAPKGEDLPPGV